MPPTTEKTFHGLKLLRSCGGGAYGEVWYGEDLSGRRMAVKIVSKTRLGDAWRRELQGVINYRRITENSPYLLRIFHVAEDAECFYYTMEAADSADAAGYVPDTLAHRLRSGALPPEQLFPVLSGIFNGLVTIHQAGFAHRDIKPDNIIFVDGMPKLSDIGLVSSLSNSMTRLAGTPDFLPPEERSGDTPGSTDRVSRQRNDLYAFGKVVYCAAAGMEPGQYPSIPTNLKPTTEQKLFLRLSFKLCARESRLRVNDLSGLYGEMKRIGRQLETGETAADKARYAAEKLQRSIFSGVLALRRIWWVLVPIALIAALVGYRLSQRRQTTTGTRLSEKYDDPQQEATTKPPQKKTTTQQTQTPSAPTTVKPATDKSGTKEYVVSSLGLKMRIPNDWQAMSDEYIRALADEMLKEMNKLAKNESSVKMLKYATEKAKSWRGMIRCGVYDVIEISHVTLPAAADEMWNMSDGKLRFELLALFGTFKPAYAATNEFKRLTLAGKRCVILEFYIGNHQTRRYIFFGPGREAVVVAMMVTAGNFDNYSKEFDAALKTLAFAAPMPTTETSTPTPRVKTLEKVPTQLDDSNSWKYRSSTNYSIRLPFHWTSLSFQNIGLQESENEFWHLSDEDIRAQTEKRLSPYAAGGIIYYSVSHTNVGGRKALLEIFSDNNIEGIVINYKIFSSARYSDNFSISTDYANFVRRKKEFEAVMKTLKFTSPPPAATPAPEITPPPQQAASPAPKTSRQPGDPNTRKYVNRRHGFSMRVPLHWELLTKKYIEDLIRDQQAILKRGGKPAIMAKVKIDHFHNILRNGGAAFHCSVGTDFNDCVEIAPLFDIVKKELWDLSDEELRGTFQLEAKQRSMPVAVYSVDRTRIAGKDALVVESSNNAEGIRSMSCIVFVGDSKIITFAVSAKYADFARRKKEFETAMKTLKFTAGTENVYDLSRKKVETFQIGGTRTSRYRRDDLINAEVEIPGTWFKPAGYSFSLGELVLYDDDFYGAITSEYSPAFSIENRHLDKADSNIRLWNTCLVSTDLLRNGSAEQLKDAIRKDFYLEYALPSTKFWKKGFDVAKRLSLPEFHEYVQKSASARRRLRKLSIPEFLKYARTVLPEESIAVGEIKRFSVGGQPAVYAGIDSPSTHKHRKLVYVLVAPKGLKNCLVILLDADEKKEELRKKQLFEFCRHLKIFTK